ASHRRLLSLCSRSGVTCAFCATLVRSFNIPYCSFFFFNHPPTSEIYTLSLHDALPILGRSAGCASQAPPRRCRIARAARARPTRSEEHTSELQSLRHLVCRLLLEKKNNKLQRNCFMA